MIRLFALFIALVAMLATVIDIIQAEEPAYTAPAMLPFDDKIYDLSYEIFLANRNLKNAYLVAESAVKQRPNDPKWRQRLAQVAEWSQKPSVALEQWLHMGRNNDNPNSWNEVMRLATGMFNHDAIIESLEFEANSGRFPPERLKLLIDSYEAAGRVREGIIFLETLNQRKPRREILEHIAYLNTRLGNDDAAIQNYRELLQGYGDSVAYAMKLAGLLIAKSQLQAASEALEQVQQTAGKSDHDYWQLYGELAWRGRKDTAAQHAYDRLARGDKEDPQAINRLITLLRARQPNEAVRIAETMWRKYGKTEFLTIVLELNSQYQHWQHNAELLQTLTPAQRRLIETDPRLLLLRGQTRQHTGQNALALADYQAVLLLDPINTEARTAILWLLIDTKDLSRLQRYVDYWQRQPRRQAELWDAYAAAYIVLNKPRLALRYYVLNAQTHKKDFLWLTDYADILETNGQVDMADKIRRQVWRHIHRQADVKRRGSLPLLARLAIAHYPGDPTAYIIRELLSHKSEESNTSSQDLALSWLLNTEQYDNAERWLWQRYAKATKKPAWAEFAVALARHDRQKLTRLLDNPSSAVSVNDRLAAANELEEPYIARDIAFNGLDNAPGNDDLHTHLISTLHDFES